MQLRLDRAHRRIDLEDARSQFARKAERGDQADRAMAAHPQVAHIIEKNHAELAVGAVRFNEQRAHEGVRTPRLVHDCGAVGIETLAEPPYPLLEGTHT